MDSKEVRAILSAYRAGDASADEARFAEARRQAETDGELAQWWQDEQELDHLIGEKLGQINVPAGLKARLLEPQIRSLPSRSPWTHRLATLAAAIVLLAVFFGSWQGLFQPATSLAEYRDEMVSFVRLDPSLDLKSSDLTSVSTFLKTNGAPSEIAVPPPLQALKPVGGRTLRFRGQSVALICFLRGPNELVHLLTVDRKAMAKTKHTRENPEFVAEGEWMTAMWSDENHTYLLATKAPRETLAKYLGTS